MQKMLIFVKFLKMDTTHSHRAWQNHPPRGPNPPSMGVSIFKKITNICIFYIFGVQNGGFGVQNGGSKLGF